MRFVFVFSIALICLAASAAAQDPSDRVSAAQKELKAALRKHSSRVSVVGSKGCLTSVKVVWWPASPTESRSPAFVGGGFPEDDSSKGFSHGAGAIVGNARERAFRYEIDLSKLSESGIRIEPVGRRGISQIVLADDSNTDAVRITGDNLYGSHPVFAIAVQEKGAIKTADALRTAIRACQ